MAYGRMSAAIEAGFYLEAIALTESIVSDRLESRLSALGHPNCAFQPLGELIKAIRKWEPDAPLRALVEQDLDSWRVLRNQALHEMVKVAVGDPSNWDDRMLALVLIAEEGRSVLRRIDNRRKALRRAAM